MAHNWPQNTLLLKVDGKSVGFACVGKSKDTDGADEVIAIYLLKEYQGKKLGCALLKEAISRLSDSRKIVLWVLQGNDRAIRFYQKFGFAFNGKEKTMPSVFIRNLVFSLPEKKRHFLSAPNCKWR